MRVDVRRIKAEDELKSIFGAKTIHAVAREDGGRGAPRGPAEASLGRRGPGGRAAAAQASLVAASARERPGLLQGHLARAQTRPVRSADGVRRRGPRLVGEGARYVRDGESGEDAKRAFDAARARTIRTDSPRCCTTTRGTWTRSWRWRTSTCTRARAAQRGDAREGSVRPGGRVAPVVRGPAAASGGARMGRLGRRARERALLRRHVQARQRAQPEVPPRRARDRQIRARVGTDGPARVPVLRRLLRAEGGAGAEGGAEPRETSARATEERWPRSRASRTASPWRCTWARTARRGRGSGRVGVTTMMRTR